MKLRRPHACGPRVLSIRRQSGPTVQYVAILSTVAAPAAAQDCVRPELGDQVQLSGAFAAASQPALGGTEPVPTTTTGYFIAYRGDSVSVVERRNANPVRVPYASLELIRVACGRDWATAIYPGLVGAAAGGAIATSSAPGGGTAAGAAAAATLGALVGVSFAYAIGLVRPRWVETVLPPETGALGPSQIDRLGARRGKGRLAIGGLIVAVSLGPMISDSSLSDDSEPYVMAGIGLAIAAWGAASWISGR